MRSYNHSHAVKGLGCERKRIHAWYQCVASD
jgi:hypothetical protein